MHEKRSRETFIFLITPMLQTIRVFHAELLIFA